MIVRAAFEIKGPAGPIAVFDTRPDAGVTAEPVLLVHGINMSRDVWSDVIERLGQTRRVVSFDLRGHGGSGRAGPFTADAYADDALAVLDALGIARAHIVGTSFGGSVACTLAVRSPARIVSIASFGGALAVEGVDTTAARAALRAAGVRGFFTEFLPAASFAPGTDRTLIDRAVAAASTDRDLETVVAVVEAAMSADIRAVAAAARVPALVVTGELDLTCPLDSGRALAQALQTELIVLPGVGHVLSMEAPEQVATLIEQHVATNSQR